MCCAGISIFLHYSHASGKRIKIKKNNISDIKNGNLIGRETSAICGMIQD